MEQKNTNHKDLDYWQFRKILYGSFEQHGYIGQLSGDDGVPDFHHYLLKQETKKLWFIPITTYAPVAEVFEPSRFPLRTPILEIKILDKKEEQNLKRVAGSLRELFGPKGLEVRVL